MTAPITAVNDPIISNLSGFFLSTKSPQMTADIIKIPPYAAYTLPKLEGCNVGIIPYKNRTIPPINPKTIPFLSRNHFHTR